MADEQAPWDTTASGETAPWESAAPDAAASQHPLYDAQGNFWAGVGDAGLTAVTGTLGAGAAGVADLYSRITGKSDADRQGADAAVQDAITHQPTTKVGKAIIGGAANLVGHLSGKDWANGVGDAELMDSVKNDPAFKGLSPQQAREKINSDPQYTVGSIADAAARRNVGDVATDVAENTAGVAGDVGNIAGAAMLRPTVKSAGAISEATMAARAAKVGESIDAPAEAVAAKAAETPAPPKEAPGPVTAEDLQTGPQRLPEPKQEAPAAPAAEAQPAAAPAPEAPAEPPAPEKPPLEAPARDEAEIASGKPPDEAAQKARGDAIQQLQEDTGAQMPNVRKSAITGDYRETGTDYQLGELGEPNMRAQLDQENHALTTASQQQVDRTGGVARGVGQAAVEQRGTIIDRALQGVNDWFDHNIRGLYSRADAAAGQKPMTKFDNTHAILDDHSQFTGTEGMQLHGDVQRVAKQFGMMNEQGFWQPSSVATTEKFRQWLGEQYTPRTGRTIGRLKDALDSDVAAHGGGGLYDEARALRYKKAQMLEGPTGIRRLLPDKLPDGRLINRPVALDKIADHITDLPKEQFDHIINTLHDSGKLGSGELAKGNADAINEIRRHMAERLHEAGSSGRDGMWNPHAYHDQLDAYSTKLPGVFAPEGMRRFQTIHDAGNALRLNKRYPGAAKQLMQAGGMGEGTRKRIASTIEGGALGWLGPLKAGLADATGLSGAVREGIERVLPGGNAEKRNATMVSERTQPLGSKLPNQRGAVGHLNAPGVEHDYNPSTGHHEVNSPNGVTHANDHADGKSIIMDNTGNARDAQGNTMTGTGEGYVRTKKLADAAIERGGELHSDSSVSSHQAPVYSKLAQQGYKVELHPEAVRTEAPNGKPRYEAPRGEAAFRVSKPTLRVPQAGDARTPLGQNPAFRRQAGYIGNPYESAPAKPDPWGNERAVNDRTLGKDKRASDPYNSGGGMSTPLGARIGGGRQRGAVGVLNKVAEAKDEESPMVNIGLHQGDPAKGGRVMSKQEVMKAIKDTGAKVVKNSVQQSSSEPTLVASLDRPLTQDEAHGVSTKLGQDAIAQRNPDGSGMLAGPKAAEWGGKYDPEQFQMHDGRSAVEHDAQNAGYNDVKQHLTDKEQADIESRSDSHRASAIKNLLDTFHGSTSVEGTSAMALAGEAKKGWYEKAGKAINGVFGPDAPRFTALLAAMSPQTSVEMNFHNALRTFVNWDKGGRPTDPGAIKKIMEDSSLKNPDSESRSNVMDAWHQNGVRALTSADPEHEGFQLSGPKVDSFHKNLRGHTNEVTNDSWNAIATNIDQKLFSGAYRAVPGDIFGRMGFKSPTYMGVSAKVRAAAMNLSKLTGEKWSPSEVQETMWSFVKTAFEHAKATGKSIPELMKSGELNDELIRGTSDFHTLFNAPEHRGFLDDSRFGAAARRVATGEGDSAKPANASQARTAAEEHLRPALVSEGQRLEQARQARLANRKARIGNIQVPF